MLETCPHCAASVLFANDYCPSCQKSKVTGMMAPNLSPAVSSTLPVKNICYAKVALGVVAALALVGLLVPWGTVLTRQYVYAAAHGRTSQVRLCLRLGANVNAKLTPNGWTALHYAATGAHLETVRLLLDSGANVRASGTLNTDKPFIYATPKVAAQSASNLYDLVVVRKAAHFTKETVHLPGDLVAARRYETIIKLLEERE